MANPTWDETTSLHPTWDETYAPGELEKAEAEQKYGGLSGEAKAFGLGALRGATLSGSDYLLTKTGAMSPDEIKGYQNTNPISSTTGEVGGAVTSAVLAPELAPVAMIGKAGTAVANAARSAELLGGLARSSRAAQVLSSLGATAAGSAVEGALYSGIGNTVNEYSLGDPDLNGQKFLSVLGHNLGQGAMYGAAIGTALKGAELGIPPSLKAAKQGLVDIRDKLIGSGVGGSSGLAGKALDTIDPSGKLSEYMGNRMTNLGEDEKVKVVRETTSDLNTVHKNIETTIKDLNEKLRPEETEALIGSADPIKAEAAARDVVNTMDQALKQAKALPQLYQQSAIAKLEDLHQELSQKLVESSPLETFEALRDAKQRLGKMAFTKLPTETTEDTVNLLKGVTSQANNVLKDPDIFGHAGASLAAHDDMLSQYYQFIKPGRGMTDFQKTFGKLDGRGRWAFDPKKVELVFKRGNTLTGQDQMRALDSYFDTLKSLPDHIESTMANVPNSNMDHEALKNMIDNSHAGTVEAHEKYVDSIGKNKNSLGFADLAAASIAVSHPAIGAMIEAYNVARNPISAMNKLAEVERILGKSTQAISRGAKAIFDTGVETTHKSMGTLLSFPIKERLSEHAKIADNVADMNSNPGLLMDRLAENTQSLHEAAPNTAGAVQSTQTMAISFLASKLPPRPPSNPFSEPYKPSNSEMAMFERYVQIVEKPIAALDLVKQNTITNEAVETLNAVYPKLYNEMKSAVLKEATDILAKKQTIPYQTKQSLSIFLGQPLEQSMTYQNVMNNQIAFQPPAPTQGQTKPSKTGMGKMTVASRTGLDRGNSADSKG